MFDVNHIVQAGGLLLVAAIIFGESGLMVGFFFPGDTLLLSAGFFASQGKLPLFLTMLVVAGAAIVGDNLGYQIGRSTGPRLFNKKDSLLFRQQYLEQSERFYNKYGSKTMLLAHFIPVVRTFAPILAGIGRMPRVKFIAFDAVGDISWAVLVIMLGYWFGRKIPNIDSYFLPVFIAVSVLTFAPTIYHIIKDPQIRRSMLQKLRLKT